MSCDIFNQGGRYLTSKDAPMMTSSARFRIVLAVAAVLVTGLIGDLAVAQPARRLPAAEAYDLAGEARRFPSGLPTELTLVIAAFDRAQQSIADRLFDQIAEAGATQLGIATLETPVIQDPGRVARFFIDNGMKGGILDPEKRKVVVTLYVKDLDAWLAETGLGSKSSVHLMAVTRSGRIVQSARAEALADVEAVKSFIAGAQKQMRN
jgi:hypothetical protein